MEHFLRLVAAQSTATIGSVTRAWLRVVAVLWPSIGAGAYAVGIHPFKGQAIASAIIGLPCAVVVSLPIMAVLAIIHIARNW